MILKSKEDIYLYYYYYYKIHKVLNGLSFINHRVREYNDKYSK